MWNGVAAGQAFFILLSAGLLTIPVALFLLWRYGSAVKREMTSASKTAMDAVPSASQGRLHSPLPALAIENIDLGPEVKCEAYDDARRSLHRAVLIYAAAGLAYALPFAIAWSYQADGALLAWRRITLLAGVQYWPAVIAMALIAASSRVERLKIFAVLFGGLAAFSMYELAISPNLTVMQLAKLWLVTNGPPTLLIAPLLIRRVRAIAPLVLSFLLVIITGALITVSLLLLPRQGMVWVVNVGTAIGLGGTAIFYGLHLAGLLIFAVPGWWLLRYFGSLYRRKRTSEQSIMLDSLFFVFTFEQTLVLSAHGQTRFLIIGPISFGAYKLVKWIGFRALRCRSEDAAVLLLLRVFALNSRSEQLFDSLTRWWRRVGSLVMIAGPDLIRSTIQPHELLEFVGGNISRRFVASSAQLAEQITSLDLQADPDGRYRINQFFCHRDSWQSTMRQLAKRSSVVLMDLRSFSARNQGCIYELGQLLNSVDLRRVVFVIDETTDRQFLTNTLSALWQQLLPDSPNASALHPTVQLYTGNLASSRDFRRLLQRLLQPTMASSVVAA